MGATLSVVDAEVRPTARLSVPFDARIAPGEGLGVTGPSGSGKTTLLRAIAGLRPWHRGAVTLDGRSPEEIGWPAFRRRVVFVAQRAAMLPGTVRKNLERPFDYRTATETWSPDQAEDLLSRFRLPDDALDRAARELSAGEQQRVALIRALLVKPDVLLLDEPTAALDEAAAREVEALLTERLEAHEVSLVLVTHDPAQGDRLGLRHHALVSSEVSV